MMFGLTLMATLYAHSAFTGPVTIPNTFESGEPALAAEVNGNFSAIETAIDDNDARITTNTDSIDDVDSRLGTVETGFVSMSPSAFKPDGGAGCTWRVFATESYGAFATGSDTNCDLVANVNLPHYANITELSCYFWDTSITDSIDAARLYRTNLTEAEPTPSTIYATTGTMFSNDTIVRKFSDSITSVVGADVVDNSTYTYHLHIIFSEGTDTADQTLRLYGCTVGYE